MIPCLPVMISFYLFWCCLIVINFSFSASRKPPSESGMLPSYSLVNIPRQKNHLALQQSFPHPITNFLPSHGDYRHSLRPSDSYLCTNTCVTYKLPIFFSWHCEIIFKRRHLSGNSCYKNNIFAFSITSSQVL